MAFDNAYEAINEDNDARWAYGTGFTDPFSGIDAAPATPEIAALCRDLGDDALIMSHRLQEWCTCAPELEDEVALANIALDLLGQARFLYQHSGADEDALAFTRDAADFRNVRLAELPNGDFAWSMARLLIFSLWRLALLDDLTGSADPILAAIAAKGVKELAYHRDYAARWVVRLGDGTTLSHDRMQAGLNEVWPYVADLGMEYDVLTQVVSEATLTMPDAPGDVVPRGTHTDALAPLLAEMQSVARALPGATW